jgi:hypothetical protein
MAKKTVQQDTQDIENGALKIENGGVVETPTQNEAQPVKSDEAGQSGEVKNSDEGKAGAVETNPGGGDEAGTNKANSNGGDETDPKGDSDETNASEAKPDGEGDEMPAEVVVGVIVEDSDKKESGKLKSEARRIMQGQNAKRVWRCPKTGYWFTKKDLAEQHAKAQNVTMKLLEWED